MNGIEILNVSLKDFHHSLTAFAKRALRCLMRLLVRNQNCGTDSLVWRQVARMVTISRHMFTTTQPTNRTNMGSFLWRTTRCFFRLRAWPNRQGVRSVARHRVPWRVALRTVWGCTLSLFWGCKGAWRISSYDKRGTRVNGKS